MSPATRSVTWFCKLNSVPHLHEHKSPVFVTEPGVRSEPFINDNGKIIHGSHPILRYLPKQYNLGNHWYPENPYRRAKIDEFLQWHSSNLRTKVIETTLKAPGPWRGLRRPTKGLATIHEEHAEEILNHLNVEWLKHNNFIGGTEISIADVIAATEVAQLEAVNYDTFFFRPFLHRWYSNMKNLPHSEELQASLWNSEEKEEAKPVHVGQPNNLKDLMLH
eukprot:CAMPEP_0168566822 /NCGR_PEP_ID=MMETSP0413-20121227/14635_1 /TAXON_ID=136452 /ORGANISM="Filamoeba nolandi, Strain NC-AS-23-1" /LENGTH=219 /DNA_ID=CAMNT_0008598889 /DNA_START=1 /DNA_END=657 /DNA_ORIENTATION=+